ncbi:hypothetical protein KC19_1G209700 [Ceratodon purpureus]|uniref:Uncharacterized protein n=1 Tax=Ceratodon purpureus TaxID=3225 RepID=A0A8T0JAM2_CERPU|nr:hypothetical protein KC19_1G209700 [Ceratodon purpureus]
MQKKADRRLAGVPRQFEAQEQGCRNSSRILLHAPQQITLHPSLETSHPSAKGTWRCD